MIRQAIKYTLVLVAFLAGRNQVLSQTSIPEVLNNGTLSDQMTYLEERTRIYENYRAIREDMFQLIKRNSLDSLSQSQKQLALLAGMNRNLIAKLDSVTITLGRTNDDLERAINSKNSIKVLGIEVNKFAYNTIMWIIIAVLLFVLGSGFIGIRRNVSITRITKKELEELKTEFENYRQKTRLEREKMSMDHFNEIKRLKGK